MHHSKALGKCFYAINADNRKINIFVHLTDQKSFIVDNPATAELRELRETEWVKLQHQGRKSIPNGPTAVAEFNDQFSKLVDFDGHAIHVGQILHQQQLGHPRHDVYESDLWTREHYLNQARKDWNSYGDKQLKLNAQRVLELKLKKEKAKRNNDQAEVAELVREIHGLESQILYHWDHQMERKSVRNTGTANLGTNQRHLRFLRIIPSPQNRQRKTLSPRTHRHPR